MSYVTLLQLSESPGARELAQVATPEQSDLVDSDLMHTVLIGGDTSAYNGALVDVAEAALARIVALQGEADGLIDGYLGKRYTLPLTGSPAILVTWAKAIVRYKLHQHRISDERSDPIARDYRDALKFLKEVSEGKFSLGLEDPVQSGSEASNTIQFDTGTKVFGREFLP